MADALVSVALEKLTNFMGQQLSQFAGAIHELENLSHTFESIQAVLDDAESRQVGEKHVQLWLSRLKHAAYDVEDLLEDASNNVVSRYNVAHHIIDRYNVAHRIKEIKERLDQIDVERNRFGFSSSSMVGEHRMLVRSQRQTTSLMDESEMVIGRENDKEIVISKLVSGSSCNEDRGQVQVVAIAGIGGLGKTTLARLIYHDAKVRGHFNQDLYWVCVSEPFDVLSLTKDILEEVKKVPPTRSRLNGLQDELLQLLRGKRYLLVLDDVWNDDADKWEMLRLALTSGANGSRILVTTRNEKVATTMNANYIHELKGLSDDQSWMLFSSRAFAKKRECDCSEFESIGKGIVNKCKGVPLAIKVTGSAMNTKRTVEDWKNVLESKIWSLRQATDKILPALLLTYYHLPTHLKQCFAYCSIFPKDWKLEKDVLVRLWVAHDFIQSEGSREKEDIGDEYFDELVAWSMLQEIEENYEGKVTCKMHDLLHDLAELIAKDEIYTFISKSKGGKLEECPSNSGNIRHAFLSFADSDDKPSILMTACRAKKLRTLWLDRTACWPSGTVNGGITSVIDELIHEARFLRALYFHSPTKLPKSIGKLKHLRYLCLPGSKIVNLPNAIGLMEQLRCLDLSYNLNMVELPESVSDLRNLHTLNLSHCEKLEKLPRGTGRMVSLRYLNLSNNSNMVELLKSVSDLRNLHTLDLSHCGNLKKLPRGIGRMVSLRYLNLSHNSNIVELPESVNDLCNLHALDLSHCRKLKKLPRGIGGMVSLRYLYLNYNSNIMELPESMSDLRNLHTLNLSNCEKLGKLPRGIGRIVGLRHLEIKRTDRLKYLPKGLGRIGGLRSLSKFIVGGGDEGEECGIHELQSLNSLQGTLEIEHLERVSSREEAEKAELWKKQHLCRLAFWMSVGRHANVVIKRNDSMLEGLRPHENLEELVLNWRTGSKLPNWMDGMRNLRELLLYSGPILERVPHLPNLKKFKIWGVRGEKLPNEGWEQLAALQKLKFYDCKELKCLPEGLTQLPSLESLRISYCYKLESLPGRLGQFKKLHSLTIDKCQKLESLPDSLGQLRKLKSLCVDGSEVLRERCKREGGVDWPNISHIPNIIINGRVLQGRR